MLYDPVWRPSRTGQIGHQSQTYSYFMCNVKLYLMNFNGDGSFSGAFFIYTAHK